MSKSKLCLVVAVMAAVVLVTATISPAQQRAFPGAEGYGAFATGGRGGAVYHVTRLDLDSDCNTLPGTLRHGVKYDRYSNVLTGPQTIVFDVGGNINLSLYRGKLSIRKPGITIAGQTAPSDSNGICIRYFQISTDVNAPNLVLQHLRVRPGYGTDGNNLVMDAIGLSDVDTAIVDHCSATWGTDECLSASNACNNITVQWCLIGEGINNATHGYGSLISPQTSNVRESWHHNLWAHHIGRMPRIAGQNSLGNGFLADVRNNVTYNWSTSGDWGCRGTVSANEYLDTNWINNYAIAGSNSSSASYANTVMTSTTSSATCRIYHSGNYIDYDKDATHGDGVAVVNGNFKGTRAFMGSAFSIDANYAVTTDTAATAYTNVLAGAGATKPYRDSVDARIAGSVSSRTGRIITDESQVGGWPTFSSGTTPTDTDQDGMPDAWETAYGTNPNVADNNGDLDSDGYTNLEEYIHSRS